MPVVVERREILFLLYGIDNRESAGFGDGSAEPDELFAVELIDPAEVVDDFSHRFFGDGVALVVGELEVFDGGAVLVLSFCGAQIHAYVTIML